MGLLFSALLFPTRTLAQVGDWLSPTASRDLPARERNLWGPATNREEAEGEAILRTGIFRGRRVTYSVVANLALYEGDIILGPASQLEAVPNEVELEGISIAYPSYLWPNVEGVYQIPYVNTGAPGNVAAAVSAFNTTFGGFLEFVPRTAETDYVNVNLNAGDTSGVCFSNVGRIGGMQMISGSASCSTGGLLHEMGHTIGLWHEQSRADRDSYVFVQYNNIIKGSRPNFDQLFDNAQSLGLYDYRSVMHYYAFAFSRNGDPTIESVPAGIPLSNDTGYTESDSDSISRLYNSAPTGVTITSNPPGLQVIVDGLSITTPQTFAFDLGSTHTLDVPLGSQTLAGKTYVYGRWNDDATRSHTITITPGNGLPAAPATSPAVTVYTANFIELVPFTQAVTPPGAGTMAVTPLPASYPPAVGLFYIARQAVTLEAAPQAGYNFYGWLGVPGPSGINPKVVRTPGDVTAAFTASPVTTIATNPPGRWIWVDGNFYFGPQSFAPPYDPGWTPDSTHNVNALISPQLPYSVNSRYAFVNWSDGGAQSHDIRVAAGGSSVTANFMPQYALASYVTPSCGGTLSVAPTSPDGFYASGTRLTFTESNLPGWIFTGWQGDLGGTVNPQSLTVSDEVLVSADFNTASTPLTVANLDPPQAVAGGDPFTLTIRGTGFTSRSIVFVNNIYRPSTFVSPSELSVSITADDIATAGAFQVGVSNFPEGARCAAYVARTFFVANAP